MKRKKNRGITLIELIISIALISIVVMFLFRLLIDVRYYDNNIDYNRKNQQTRAIIIKTIQTDFLERKLVGLKDATTNNNQLLVEFRYADGSIGELKIDTESNMQYVSYKNSDGTEKWYLEKVNSSTKYNVNCVTHSNSIFTDTDGEFFYLKFTIPMDVKASSKNYIDDLEFFYLGEKKDVDINNFAGTNKGSLGYYNANNC